MCVCVCVCVRVEGVGGTIKRGIKWEMRISGNPYPHFNYLLEIVATLYCLTSFYHKFISYPRPSLEPFAAAYIKFSAFRIYFLPMGLIEYAQ